MDLMFSKTLICREIQKTSDILDSTNKSAHTRVKMKVSTGTQPPHFAPPGFTVRDATIDDVSALTDLWYASFNPSHKFWDVMTPDDEPTRQWWSDTWAMGIKAGSDILRTFVVEDLSEHKKLVAFARWNVPQPTGGQDIPLPPFLPQWDAELVEAFWGGMPRNRLDVMGQRPHWMLEFLGVDRRYQERGLGFALVSWGCSQADAQGLEVYLDATIKGLPFYRKYFGFQGRKLLSIPTRPDTFGAYELVAVVRPPERSRLEGSIAIEIKHPVGSTVTELSDVVD